MPSFFNESELQELADALAAVTGTANLLGRARVRKRQEQAEQAAKVPGGVSAFAEAGTDFSAFADRIEPMAPERAVRYFRGLVPTMRVNLAQFGEAIRGKAFTMAHAADETMLGKVKGIIQDLLETGQGVRAAPKQIDEIMDRAGVTPGNSYYSTMLTRTNVMGAYNRGGMEEMQAPGVKDFFPVWRYIGIEDGRQRHNHEVHFGKYYENAADFEEVRDSEKGEFDGFSCRCGPQPVSKYEWAELRRSGARAEKFAERFDEHARDEHGRFAGSGGGGASAAAPAEKRGKMAAARKLLNTVLGKGVEKVQQKYGEIQEMAGAYVTAGGGGPGASAALVEKAGQVKAQVVAQFHLDAAKHGVAAAAVISGVQFTLGAPRKGINFALTAAGMPPVVPGIPFAARAVGLGVGLAVKKIGQGLRRLAVATKNSLISMHAEDDHLQIVLDGVRRLDKIAHEAAGEPVPTRTDEEICEAIHAFLEDKPDQQAFNEDSTRTQQAFNMSPRQRMLRRFAERRQAYEAMCGGQGGKPGPCPTKQPDAAAGGQSKADAPKLGQPVIPKNLEIDARQAPQLAASAKKLFGKDVDPHTLAAAAGATENAKVRFVDLGKDGIHVFIEGDGYKAERRFTTQRSGFLGLGGKSVVCENRIIKVEATGGGLGTKIFTNQVNTLKSLGVGSIKCDAKGQAGSKANGYSTWFKAGYNAPVPKDVAAKLPPALRGAKDMAALTSTKEGRDWWAANGHTVEGAKFDLKDNSLSMRRLGAYLEERGKR